MKTKNNSKNKNTVPLDVASIKVFISRDALSSLKSLTGIKTGSKAILSACRQFTHQHTTLLSQESKISSLEQELSIARSAGYALSTSLQYFLDTSDA